MSQPAVSVLMSAYNTEKYVGAAIESILAQTFGDFEFVILDDGSTDGTLQVLRRYEARDARIRVIARENKGLTTSLNQLLGEARAPLIARMDSDDLTEPDRFAKQVAFMAANPACGVLGAWGRRMDENGVLWPDYLYQYPVTADDFIAAVGNRPLILHPSVMMRTALVRQAGGYHRAFRHAEDFDFWLRLSDVTEICNLPEPLVTYRTYDGQVSTRHIVEQRVNAGISLHAWRLRRAGQADPTAAAERLPTVGEIDAFFGQAGIEKDILARVVPEILHRRIALRDDGVRLISRHLAHGNDATGLWRAVVRLIVTFREWKAGLALACVLLKARRSRPLRPVLGAESRGLAR